MTEKLLEIIPKLNHDQVVDLALYVAFEAKINEKELWRALEQAALDNLHLYGLEDICRLEWATAQLRPKQTTQRFGTLLSEKIEQVLESRAVSHHDLCVILQGTRHKKSRPMHNKIRKLMIDLKEQMFPGSMDAAERRDAITNLFITYASCKPKDFGIMKQYHKEEVEELLAHYEHDLCEIAENADPEQLTRVA